MELWERVLGPGGFSAADAVRAVTKGQEDSDQGASELLDAFWSTTARDTKNLPPALGRWLSGKDGVVIEGRRFVSVGRKTQQVPAQRHQSEQGGVRRLRSSAHGSATFF